MNTIMIAVLFITFLGAVCAALLSIASKLMAVKSDPRINQITEALPGTNCGACGYPGCAGYASALAADTAVKANLCTPGGIETAKKISTALGIETSEVTKKTAYIHCGGDTTSRQKKMDYKAIPTCYAAGNLAFSGESACSYGCLGYGDCQSACPYGAICIENGLARVNPNLCTGCSLCVKICPSRIIKMENTDTKVFIACSNLEKGAAARKKCKKACLACGRCARECPEKAITIENNLAQINPDKCNNCLHCHQICPTQCIVTIT